MTVNQVIDEAFDLLGDKQRTYWTTDEVLSLLNEGLKEIAFKTGYFKKTETINLSENTNEYTIDTSSYKIEGVYDSNGLAYEIKPYTIETRFLKNTYLVLLKNPYTLYFTNPLNTTVEVDFFYTPFVQLGDNLTDLPDFAAEGLKYFIVAYCYLKDKNTENMQKAQLYNSLFEKTVSRLADLAFTGYSIQPNTTDYQGF